MRRVGVWFSLFLIGLISSACALYFSYEPDVMPETTMVCAGVLSLITIGCGLSALISNGHRNGLCKSIGDVSQIFECMFVDDDGGDFEVKLVFGQDGLLIDDDTSSPVRVFYSGVKEWDVQNGRFEFSSKTDNVIRTYDMNLKSRIQEKALESEMEKFVG